MAELNFGLLTPPGSESIGNAFVRGQDQALASQQMQRQGQLADLQLKKAQNDADILEKIRSASVANGGPPDLTRIAHAMINSGNPEYITQGQGILVKVRQQAEAANYRKRALESDVPAQGAMPVAAPPANSMFTAAAPQGDFLAAGNQLMPGAVNNMPGAAPAPVVNNMPGVTPAAPAPQAALQARHDKLVRDYHFIGNNPELQSEKALLLEQIKDVQRQARDANTPSPDIKLMTALGLPSTPAGFAELTRLKNNPSEFEALVRTLPLGEQQAARGSKIKKESTVADPTTVAEYNFAKSPAGGGFPGTYNEFLVARAKAGRTPAQPAQPVAPTLTEVTDPKDPTKLLRVDARRYMGGSMGDAGVLGVSGKEPSAALRENKIEAGKTLLADELSNLRAALTKLDETRAIPSAGRGALSNVASSISASGLGQATGRVFGTEAQVERDVISSSKLRLLNAVKQATGMSAQQLNSNVELQTMLKSISDPGQSVEAALRIIDDIENAYVKGAGMPKKNAKPSADIRSQADAILSGGK